jgi:hypothetical protein
VVATCDLARAARAGLSGPWKRFLRVAVQLGVCSIVCKTLFIVTQEWALKSAPLGTTICAAIGSTFWTAAGGGIAVTLVGNSGSERVSAYRVVAGAFAGSLVAWMLGLEPIVLCSVGA